MKPFPCVHYFSLASFLVSVANAQSLVFTTQPQSASLSTGTKLVLRAVANGATSYQWMKNGVAVVDGRSESNAAISGAKTATLTIENTTTFNPYPGTIPVSYRDSGTYTCVATNVGSSAVSAPAVVWVGDPVSVTLVASFSSTGVRLYAPVTMRAEIGGTAPITLQWYKDGNRIPGATDTTLFFESAQVAHAGQYSVIGTNPLGPGSSQPTTLNIVGKPVISLQPTDQAVQLGSPATFTVTAGDTPAPTFQWFFNGSPIPGATNANYSIISATQRDAGRYFASISNPLGSVATNVAQLTVSVAPTSPVVLQQPAALTAIFGTGASLTVVAESVSPQTYQWLKDGTLISGQTGPTYTIPNVTYASAGGYQARVTNSVGSTLSQVAVVTVVAPPVANASWRMVNMSVRSQIASGGNLVMGFVITGSVPKPVLIRAIGPTLAAFGVSSAHPDPIVQVTRVDNQESIGVNDNWSGAEIAAAAAAAGAFALPVGSRDAAILVMLAPGAYTAQVTGPNGTSGTALVEVYETP